MENYLNVQVVESLNFNLKSYSGNAYDWTKLKILIAANSWFDKSCCNKTTWAKSNKISSLFAFLTTTKTQSYIIFAKNDDAYIQRISFSHSMSLQISNCYDPFCFATHTAFFFSCWIVNNLHFCFGFKVIKNGDSHQSISRQCIFNRYCGEVVTNAYQSW